MRIYFLNPPFIKNFVRCGRWQGVAARGKTLYYPLWLSYATGYLKKQDHHVRLVDAIAWGWDEQKVTDDVKNFKPDILVVDTNFSCMDNDINFLNSLKKLNNTLTVIVGPPASQFPVEILDKGVDIVARFEYEQTINEIAEYLSGSKNLVDIHGISYKMNNIVIHNSDRLPSTSDFLDKLPFVSEVYKDHLNIRDYFLSHSLYPMVQIFTGRGCPNYCTFCSWPETLMGRKYRVRSVNNVIEEFEYIIRELPDVKEIFIEDDAFTINKRWIKRFCDELKKRKVKISWSCQTRADLDYETMLSMKKTGCRLLDVGYESGSDEILKNIKKGITVDELKRFTKDAKRAKLKILADFVIGFPGESKKTVKETIDFIKTIKPDLLQVAIATPMPGTNFYKYCQENQYIKNEDLSNSIDQNGFQKCIISYPNLNSEEISYLVDKTLKEYYFSTSFLMVAINNIIGENGFYELKTLFNSAKTYLKYIMRN